MAYSLINPLSPYKALTRHFSLIAQMTRRDIASRYKGSAAGLIWSFINPLLMLVVYTFVFSFVMNARWSMEHAGHMSYAVIMFAGLNMNAMFGECAMRASGLIVGNVNFVKRVVFPLETLSWSTVGAALFHLLISTIVLLVVLLTTTGSIPWTAVLFPLVVLVFVPFVAGTVWLLASLGAYLRDIIQVVPIVTTALMFLSPTLYPATMIPEPYRPLLLFNPMTIVVSTSQRVLVMGELPIWRDLMIYAVCAMAFAWLAFCWFEKTKKGFADVV